MSTATEFYGEPIYTYTREQAIEDGVLVDATVGPFADVTRQHFPGSPVAMTAGLFALIQKAVESKRHLNDYAGVWYDILWISRITRAVDRTDFRFRVIITGVGRSKYQTIRRTMAEGTPSSPVYTYMLGDED